MGASPQCRKRKDRGVEADPIVTDQQRRLLIWIALILGGGLALWELARLFPEAISADMDQARLIQAIAFLLLVSSSVVFGRRFAAKEAGRNIALWCGVFAVLGLIYTYRNELQNIQAIEYGPNSSPDIRSQPVRIEEISASEGGGFYVEGKINNAPAHFLIDTGATDIVLSPADAKRAGIDLAGLELTRSRLDRHMAWAGARRHTSPASSSARSNCMTSR